MIWVHLKDCMNGVRKEFSQTILEYYQIGYIDTKNRRPPRGGLRHCSQKEFSSTLIFFEISPEKTTFDYAKRLKKSMKSGAFH